MHSGHDSSHAGQLPPALSPALVQMEQQKHSNLFLESLQSNSPLSKKQFPPAEESCLCCSLPHPSLLILTRGRYHNFSSLSVLETCFSLLRRNMSFQLFPRSCTEMIFTAAEPAILLGLQKACMPGCLSLIFQYFLTSNGENQQC